MKQITFTIILMMSVSMLCLTSVVKATDLRDPEKSQTEEQTLKALAQIAKRKGKTLSLSLNTKNSTTFETVDTCAGPGDCVSYRLVGLSPDRNFFVVKASAWESSTLYWVSRSTGVKHEVYAEPHLSPDRRHIITANPSEFGGTNGVFLWEINDGKLAEKFHFEPTEYALYSFVRWLNPNTVELEKYMRADKAVCPETSSMKFPVRLVLEDGLWKLDEQLERATISCE
jgi:hypothetical protein